MHTMDRFDVICEIFPHYTTPIFIVGQAEGIKNIDEKSALDELKKLGGIYPDKKNTDRKFCLYKALFRSFSDDSFIYYEIYKGEYDYNPEEILERLESKKELGVEHLSSLLNRFGINDYIKITFGSLFELDIEKKRAIDAIISQKGGNTIHRSPTTERIGLKADFSIYLFNSNVLFITPCGWIKCRPIINSFVHSVKNSLLQYLPSIESYNPHLSLICLTVIVQRGYTSFLDGCNLVHVHILREQNRTLFKKTFRETYIFVILLSILAIYTTIGAKEYLGVVEGYLALIGTIGISALILGSIYWFKRLYLSDHQ